MGVKGGGCSGFQNKLDLDPKYDEKTDHKFEFHGVEVVVDKRSMLYLAGAVVDFHDDLNKRGFTITNPNDWEAITLTSLADVVNNGGLCTVDPGPYTVAKSGTLSVNYSCSYSGTPSSISGTNTATANWDKTAAFTPSGSASGTATINADSIFILHTCTCNQRQRRCKCPSALPVSDAVCRRAAGRILFFVFPCLD